MMINIVSGYSWLLTPAFMRFASDSKRAILSMNRLYADLNSLIFAKLLGSGIIWHSTLENKSFSP